MRQDIDRWNAKYGARERSRLLEPDPLLLEYRHLLGNHGLCIDVAGGTGDNGLYLERLGYHSIIVDGSEPGLRLCRYKALENGLEPMLVVADLDRFVLPESTFDVVLVFRYLNRNLIPGIRACLKDGGLLFYKTFNLRHRAKRPNFNKAFLLEDGELSGWFADWRCVATNDHDNNDEPATYWVGYKA